MALEELDCEIQESFLAGYCWADPPEDEREDLAVLLARQPNQRAFHHGLQLADVSRGYVSAASPEELAHWSQALEDAIQHTNATYGPIATVDEESGTVRLILTSDTLDGSISDSAADGSALLRPNHPQIP
jgi:hypothetical protein